MSAFDAETFLDMTMDTPLVRRPPIQVGDYTGVFGEPTSRNWVSPKDPSKSGIAFDYPILLDVPAAERERVGITGDYSVTVKWGVMVDLMPDGKSFDMGIGKNGGLRKLREAVGMNKPGDTFSPRATAGRVVKVKVGHREYPEGSGDLFEEALAIAPL